MANFSRNLWKSTGREVFRSVPSVPLATSRYMSYATTTARRLPWSIPECQYFQLLFAIVEQQRVREPMEREANKKASAIRLPVGHLAVLHEMIETIDSTV
jgi:hypothetical protein